ncbi:acetate--CoA ligase [Patescibacteria group bacterium]|nr:acetate--CoA ligase [Patescibacteria group bacterium]
MPDYDSLHKQSIDYLESFWGNVAEELLWFRPWDRVLEWKYPYARWFIGGQTNIVYNALDRHLKNNNADKLALIWVSQDNQEKKYTYRQLNEEVSKFANGLKSIGIRKGDKVAIYLPRIPEQFIAMLGCLKIGAVHSVIYSGFSAEALKSRIEDVQAKALICSNAYPYGKKTVESFKNVKEALKDSKTVKDIIVVKRTETNIEDVDEASVDPKKNYRFHWWSDLVSKQDTVCSTAIMDANDIAFILYTSGSTGKPKGVIHSHGGYQVGIYYTLKVSFDIGSEDIFWSTADAGWITGHSYMLYSPLLNGITTFIYEGTPTYPDIEIWWKLIEKYKITKFYTAPTAIRSLMKFGEEPIKKYDLSSLKILGSVGEPINPEAWLWYQKNIGHSELPIIDTWWQTETGMFMINPLPYTKSKPGSAFKPFFGVDADVVDEKGVSLAPTKSMSSAPGASQRLLESSKNMGKQGFLVIKKPWPAMLLDVFNNPQRYKETYFEKIKIAKTKKQDSFSDFCYFTGDSAKIDEDGYFWIVGRNDDVIKVSGHRLGSAELESAFVANPKVAEAAVIGKPDEVKGESIKAFIILKQGVEPSDELKKELTLQVRMEIGPIATPDEIEFVEKLPKTRSGKIMRRILKAQESGQPIGDVSTLDD